MSQEALDKSYEPHEVEKRWYSFWEEHGFFDADAKGRAPSFSIVIPPPNVTGVLHMGHALNNTLQDILCRYRRLRGDDVLWMPGTDHAGIATQNVVEKKLAEQGLTRHQVGRERFITAVWEWREKYGSAIINQLKRLGASCDWKRERFTMDEGLSRAVRKVFVELYREGLIYRGNYIINWCPRCRTALADLEVEHEAHDGHLYFIRYPGEGGQEGLVIATTRPETLLGDTAVAVHPDDDRYRYLPYDKVLLPLMNRVIPVIFDDYVDRSFGTGALKITPAHDPNDFEIGIRHGLTGIKVIGEDGIMTREAGEFAGMDRFSCREVVVKRLESQMLLVRVEPYKHSIGHCYRCRTLIEPNLSRQWFVRAKPLAQQAMEAVTTGKTRIVPDVWTKTYFEWMENIKDWCISRQIWWGHQIPAWTCGICNEMIVALEPPAECPSCGGKDLIQETDVLDTWFSSALWPFSTMGWPEESLLLKKFYPTSVLVTGFDILFFWVARMMMMGLHFMKEVPFDNVYVHALVRDEEGKKMSKSSGNVIDPIDIIEKYGTDAFRFTLAAFAAQGRDIKMSEKRVEGYRHFMNKLWNAARFSLMHINEELDPPEPEGLSLPDRWILSRTVQVSKGFADALDAFRFNDAAGILYQFAWHEFCDWYLEIIKPVIYSQAEENEKRKTLGVLNFVLNRMLILLHPVAPFITEEIWHKFPGKRNSIMKAVFPLDEDGFAERFTDTESESQMNRIQELISGIRNVRGEMNIPPGLSLDARVMFQDNGMRALVEEQGEIISVLARLKSLSFINHQERPRKAASAVVDGATVYLLLEGIIDFQKERERLEKEIRRIAMDLASVSQKLSNEDFLKKAAPEVVEKVKTKQDSLLEKQSKLTLNLNRIREMEE
ncbi:MAG: valine--tRNA ligase [Thermodesulfobacteriota bacterium]